LFVLIATCCFGAQLLTVTSSSAAVPRVHLLVAVGNSSTVAVDDSGVAYYEGMVRNELRDGIAVVGYSPPTPLIDDVVSVSLSAAHVLMVRGDGSVWGYGDDRCGQLGIDPSTVDTRTYLPVIRIPGIGGAVAVAAGIDHSLVLRRDGSVLSFGCNGSGQLGRSTGPSWLPQPVVGVSDVVALAANNATSFVVRRDGTLFGFGRNDLGVLGLAMAGIIATPTPVMTGVATVSTARWHTVVAKRDGSVWAFGNNTSGQLGVDPVSVLGRTTPAPVPGLSHVVAAAAGDDFVVVLERDGSVWSFGRNDSNQLGRLTNDQSFVPGRVDVPAASALSAGSFKWAVTTRQGELWGTVARPFGSPQSPVRYGWPGGSPQIDRRLPAHEITRVTGGAPLAGTAALVNLTVTNARSTGYLSADRCDAMRPADQASSNVNFTSVDPVANLSVVPLDTQGSFCVYHDAPAEPIVDLQGTFASTGTLTAHPMAPQRVLDTRSAAKPMAGSVIQVSTASASLPADADSAVVNLTIAESDATGFVTAGRCEDLQTTPQTSNGNFVPNRVVANMAIVPLSASGAFCVYVSERAHVIVDVQGYFAQGVGDRLSVQPPTRQFDTRATGRLGANAIARVTSGAPSGTTAVLANLTMTDAQGGGYLTADLCDALRTGLQPNSNGNYEPGRTVANLSLVPIGPDGSFCVYSEQSVHLIVDIQGSFGPTGTLAFDRSPPSRLFDSRTN
jgi:alpha-tubulin suppressor-like RCC1 family protein